MLEDDAFLNKLAGKLQTETLSLREALGSEPEALVLNALIARLWSEEKGGFDFAHRVPYSDIAKTIEEEDHRTFNRHQIGTILRNSLGMKTPTSRGVTKVEVTPAALIKASEELDIEDEALIELRDKMLKRKSG